MELRPRRARFGARLHRSAERDVRVLPPRDSGLRVARRQDERSDAINVLQIYGAQLGRPGNFRTGLDVVNTATVAVPVEVRVIDPVTGLIYGGHAELPIAPKSLLRVGAILTAVGAPQTAGLRITVAVREGTALPGGGGILAGRYDARQPDHRRLRVRGAAPGGDGRPGGASAARRPAVSSGADGAALPEVPDPRDP